MFGQVTVQPDKETVLTPEQTAQLHQLAMEVRELAKRWELLKNDVQDKQNQLERLFDTLDEGGSHLEEAANELEMAKDALSEY